ncbi:MAG: DUF5110 domain-containing protein [Chitinophagales bacterium]|nr:DUF5110 domain-containing protein [Chitinophagales bacterium]MDW8427400.1 glycoside hydrolase family 31 protein [Chitinophagales bacterium]
MFKLNIGAPKRFYSSIAIAVFHFGAIAQVVTCCPTDVDSATVVAINTSEAEWLFSSPASDVLKVVYQPRVPWPSELPSDAVILPPRRLPISFHLNTDIIATLGEWHLVFSDTHRWVSSSKGIRFVLPEPIAIGGQRGFRFRMQHKEQIFGAGGRAIPLNRRGYRLELYNQPHYGYAEGAVNLNFSVPVFFSDRGYALFFDNVSRGIADVGHSNHQFMDVTFSSGQLNFYVLLGRSLQELTRKYTELTGRQPLPPMWALGALVSRFGYQSRTQAEDVVRRMQQENFPFDAIIFDLFWFGDSIQRTLGNLDWMNPQRWPDPAGMIANFARQGIHTVLITEPFVVKNSVNYAASLPYQAVDSTGHPILLTDFYFGHAGLLDLFRNDAQQWFLNFYDKQIQNGVAGWWGDLGEPEKHPSNLYHNLQDLGFTRLFSADEVHNLYGHWWSRMLYEFYHTKYPHTRLFHLNRAGYAGSQRYSVFPWSGDVSRSWSGLRAQLPILLSLSLCGIPFIHADAGGFAMGDYDPELFTRWVQFAVFTPVLRPHGTALEELVPTVKSIPSEPVFYSEPYKSVLRKYYELRYALLPYLYHLCYQHMQHGDPIMRPLCYASFDDSTASSIADQYFFGDAILVAPVLQAGTQQRRLYLPKGSWYPLFSSEAVEGEKWINPSLSISDFPVYIRAGSFLPMAFPMKNTSSYHANKLMIDYYFDDGFSSCELYQDDGRTNLSWENRQYRLFRFQASPLDGQLHITIEDDGGAYVGMSDTMWFTLRIYGLNRPPRRVLADGRSVKKDWIWDADQRLLQIFLTYRRKPVSLQIYR